MKTCFLILFIAVSTVLSAQTPAACAISINGISKSNKSLITKDELAQLSTLEVQDPRLEKKFKPSTFDWVVSSNGQIWKGNITTLAKLKEIAPKLKAGDIIFIEKLKFQGFTGICEGQFAFTIE